MIIPLINPCRTTKKERVIKTRTRPKHKKKGLSSMVKSHSPKARRVLKIRHARVLKIKNPARRKKSAAKKMSSKKRHGTSLAERLKYSMGFKAHRPRVYQDVESKRWVRGGHTRLFQSGPTLLNPKRRGHKRVRRNPAFNISQFLTKGTMIRVAAIGIGFVASSYGKTLITKLAAKAQIIGQEKFYGIGHIVLALGIGFANKKFIRKAVVNDIAFSIAAYGIYDLIQQNLLTSLPVLPTPLDLPGGFLSASYIHYAPVSHEQSAGYPVAMGTSYGTSYGSTSVTEEILADCM